MDTYLIFASIIPASERSAWPMDLLDDEEIIKTRKTIELERSASGKYHKKNSRASATAGGSVAESVTIYEVDFAS